MKREIEALSGQVLLGVQERLAQEAQKRADWFASLSPLGRFIEKALSLIGRSLYQTKLHIGGFEAWIPDSREANDP